MRFPNRTGYGYRITELFFYLHQTAPTGLETPKLTHKVRFPNRTYRPENRTNPVNWVLCKRIRLPLVVDI